MSVFVGGPADGRPIPAAAYDSMQVEIPIAHGDGHFRRAIYRPDGDDYVYVHTLPCALCVREGYEKDEPIDMAGES